MVLAMAYYMWESQAECLPDCLDIPVEMMDLAGSFHCFALKFAFFSSSLDQGIVCAHAPHRIHAWRCTPHLMCPHYPFQSDPPVKDKISCLAFLATA